MPVGFKTTYNGRETEIDDLLIKREFFGDGGLYTWGLNTNGVLGDGTTTTRSSPGSTAAGLGLNWKYVSIGANYSTGAIKTDGTLWTWGRDEYGQLGAGTNGTSRSSPGTTAGGGTNWKQVSMGLQLGAAIKTDGTLWTWGRDAYGALGAGTNGTSRSSPGTTAGGGTNWKQVATNNDRCMAAIKTDGTLWTWGRNNFGPLGTGNETNRSSPGTTAGGGTNWSQVSVEFRRCAAVKTDGTLWTWGLNQLDGTLGTGDLTDRLSPGTTAGGGANWKQVSCGYSHMAAVKTDGTLWTWGKDGYGVLGAGTSDVSRSSPGTTAGGGTNWKEVAAGNRNTGAIKTDGTLWTWGPNYNGHLGGGSTRSSPGTTDGGITNWKQISASTQYMAGITDLTI